MSSLTAPLLSGDLSGCPLDEHMQTALLAAAVQAKGKRHSFVGVEHLLLAILNHEDGSGPGHSFLQSLKVDPPALRGSIATAADKRAISSPQASVSLRSDSRKVLHLANGLRRERGESLIHAGHVTEALVCEGNGTAAKIVSMHLGMERPQVAALSPRLRHGLRTTGLIHGFAWELPETAEDVLIRMFHLGMWNTRAGPCAYLQPGLWDQLECHVYLRRNKLRVLLCPSALTTRLGRWLCQRAVIRKSASLAALEDARRIPVPQFFREWPGTIEDLAGRLDFSFFTARKPAGQIRLLTAADEPFCRELYTHLEQRRQVPAGYLESFAQWLREPDTLRLAIEHEGALAGCGGFNLRHEPLPGNCAATPLLWTTLSFGLIHPRYQRYGLGSTLLAFRLAAGHRMGSFACTAEATSCSVGYLERAGFRFWRTWPSPTGEHRYSGAMLVNGEDATFLETWLGPERAAALRALEPPALRSLE